MVSRRVEYGDNYTISRLYVNGEYECFVLEDKVRPEGIKIFGETAIPAGKYKVIVDHSVHFGKDLPLLLGVVGFEGVRIHSGNTDLDTEGCLLVGKDWPGGDHIFRSHEAFEALFPMIKAALAAGEEVTVEIINT
jgi:hypothetical protein